MSVRMKLLAAFALVGCVAIAIACGGPTRSTATADPASDDGQLATTPRAYDNLGTLVYGQTSAPVLYSSSPRYRAFLFAGQTGDTVDIWVRSNDGQAKAWLLSADAHPLAYDFATSHDAHLSQTLSTGGSFYIVFREASLSLATFTVSLAQVLQPIPDAGVDAMDGTISDASDAGINDANLGDASDASTGVTCTFARTWTNMQSCNLCNLPPTSSVTDSNVPLIIDNSGTGVADDSTYDAGQGRTFHINAPTEFSDFGCTQLSVLTLHGGPPTESWAVSSKTGLSGYCAMLNSALLPSSVSVKNGNQAIVDMHLEHFPGVLACGVSHGCVKDSLDCAGSATPN